MGSRSAFYRVKKQKTENQAKSKQTSPVIQWLRLCASSAGGLGSIPGLGTKTPQNLQWHGQEKKTKTKTNLNLVKPLDPISNLQEMQTDEHIKLDQGM